MAKFFELHINSWEEFCRIADPLDSYYFRGHADASWTLTTSIEREFFRYDSQRLDSITNKEYWMLHEFRRKLHLYQPGHQPDQDDHVEWLALLQHHGAPTRLLDFTRSLYVAAYFALESSISVACIWAISWARIRDNLRVAHQLDYAHGTLLRDQVNLHHISFINKFIGAFQSADIKPHLVPLESKYVSARAGRQQGYFLAPLAFGKDDHISFEDNLAASFNETTEALANREHVTIEEALQRFNSHSWFSDVDVMRIVIPQNLHNQFLRHLIRMGIDREGLFPGIDGLASSLAVTKLRGAF